MKIESVRGLYGIAFALENVKATLLRDISINVSEFQVEGKEDESLNIPRWIAEVLEADGHATVEDTDMVVELKQATVKENVQGDFELGTLEPYFYIGMRSYLKRLPENDAARVASMLKTLVRKRQSKIVRRADSSDLTADLTKKLTVEERVFYNSIRAISTGFGKSVLGGGAK